MRALPLRLLPGDDLRRALEAALARDGGRGAFVLSGIGSLSEARIRLAGVAEPEHLQGDLEVLSLASLLTPRCQEPSRSMSSHPFFKEHLMTAAVHHPIDWFEIPVRDMDRAQRFYETLFAAPMRRESIGGNTLALFGDDPAAVGGCLLAGPTAPAPSESGTLIYLNAQPTLDAVLARLPEAGGRVLTPKVQLPGAMGCFAHIADSEGNRVGLHADR